MKRIGAFLLASIIGLVYICQAQPAAAYQTVTNPFGNVNTWVYIATIPPYGPWAIFERMSDHQCAFQSLGGGQSLMDDWAYDGSEATDSVYVTSSAGTYCGWSTTPIDYNGHFFDLWGNGGNDYLYSGYGYTYISGFAGNDRQSSLCPYGYSAGGTGNDIITTGSGSAEMLLGESGDDCLSDMNSSASTFNCGVGNDMYADAPVTRTGCERHVNYCIVW